MNSVIRVGNEFDYLAGRPPDVRRAIRQPGKRAAVVTSVRNEGLGLLEWVAHYRVLGFDTIFIYTNDNTDGSNALLERLAEHGIIRLRWNVTSPDVSPQMKAFRHALWFCPEVADHEWIAILDADEFLIPALGETSCHTITDYLDVVKARFSASAVCLNWKWFPGDLSFDRSPGIVYERFNQSVQNEHIKTIFRGPDVEDIANVHHPRMANNIRAIDGDGVDMVALSSRRKPVYTYGQINHYWQKSFQEFVLKKSRGRGALGLAGEQRSFEQFFTWWAPPTPDPLPCAPFVNAVRDEMERLRALPGISEEEAQVETNFSELLRVLGDRLQLSSLYRGLRTAHARQNA